MTFGNFLRYLEGDEKNANDAPPSVSNLAGFIIIK